MEIEIVRVPQDEMGPAWQGVLGDTTLKTCVAADFGFADAVICFMEFEDGDYEVGHGECLRPYDILYEGRDREEAIGVWAQHVGRLSTLTEYEVLQRFHSLPS